MNKTQYKNWELLLEDGVDGIPVIGKTIVAMEILFYCLCQDQLTSSLSSKVMIKMHGECTLYKADIPLDHQCLWLYDNYTTYNSSFFSED